LLAVASIFSANCIFCDQIASGDNSAIHLSAVAHDAPDSCNGICSCCAFHWVPEIRKPVIAFAPIPLPLVLLPAQQLSGWAIPQLLPPRA
jgi:hypothetical protein